MASWWVGNFDFRLNLRQIESVIKNSRGLISKPEGVVHPHGWISSKSNVNPRELISTARGGCPTPDSPDWNTIEECLNFYFISLPWLNVADKCSCQIVWIEEMNHNYTTICYIGLNNTNNWGFSIFFKRIVYVVHRGPEFFSCRTPRFRSTYLSSKAPMLYCWHCNKRGVIFSLGCTIFNVYLKMCPICIGQSMYITC